MCLMYSLMFIIQGAFHVVNPEDLRREIKLLLGVAAYSFFLGVVAQLYFALHGVNVGVAALFTIVTNDFILISYLLMSI